MGSPVHIVETAVSGSNVTVKRESFVGRNFQLQQRDSLTVGSWADLGAAQAGTGGLLTFTDTGSAINALARFYRVHIVP